MRCNSCNSLLFPKIEDVIRDDFNKDYLIIKCINPKCKKEHFITLNSFYELKKDSHIFFQFYDYIHDPIYRHPNEMNVVIASIERCGCSWLGFLLSLIYESTFGTPIQWNYEISTIEATRDKFPLPTGWSSVYNANPLILEHRGFDKIIVLQRDFDELLRVHAITYDSSLYNIRDKITPEFMQKHAPSFYNSFKKSYDIVYDNDFKGHEKRILRVFLKDLNRHFVQTIDLILNFLDFPEYGRPICYPVKIDRNWESVSTELSNDADIGEKFKYIDEIYENERNSRRRGLGIDEQIKYKKDILMGRNTRYDQYRKRFLKWKKIREKNK